MLPVVHFTVNTLALKRGGLVKAVRTRANLLAEAGAFPEIWIEVLGFQPALEADVAQLKAQGHLHPDIHVRSVLFSLDTSPGPEARPVVTFDGEGYTAFPADATGLTFRLFRDGLYEKHVRLRSDGTLASIDHFGPDRLRARRDDLDGSGRIVRTSHYRGASTSPVVQRYIGKDNQCFLTVWQPPGKQDWASAYLFGDEPLTFANTGALYTHAFEAILRHEPAAVICSEFRENLYDLPEQNLDDLIRAIDHPQLTKIAVAHSNHLAPPYVRGSAVSANWERLFHSLDGWDQLVVWTEAQRRDVADQFGHADRVRAIPQVAPPHAAISIETDPLRLVLVARTHPKKRVDEAIHVFRRVVDAVPGAVLEVFGFGYGDEEEDRIQELVGELGLGNSVRFMPFTSDPVEIYGSAALVLLTSASEGFPLILLESMSFGVPVAAYDANYGPSDVIEDGVNGYLAPFGDQTGLARQIVRVLRDPTLRSRLAEGCRATLDRFSSEGYVQAWTEVLASPPRRDGTIASADWEDDVLVLSPAGIVQDGTLLVVTERGGSASTEVALHDGGWRFTLPTGRPSQIYDLSVRAPAERRATRVRFGRARVSQRRPFRIYPTIHGALSIKDESGSIPHSAPAVALPCPRRAEDIYRG
jgi:poly(glycerol-phosphate) alpha-glucosyltransferase